MPALPDDAPTRANRVSHRLLRGPFLALTRPCVEGAQVVPRSGGVLLAANHRSFLDHYLLAAASPRPARFLGKVELAVGWSGRLNLALGMVPVVRGGADLRALDVLVDLLRAGTAVAVFPEGTRSPDGSLHRFRSGAARVAARAAVPVVPVGLRGTAEVWPPGGRPGLRRPGTGELQVRFGDVLQPPGTGARDRRAFTRDLEDAVAALCSQSRTSTFAPVGARAEVGHRRRRG